MKNLKTLRMEKGMSQQEFAEAIHASQNTVSQWENGTRKPAYDIVETLADFFNVSIDYLLGKSDLRNPLDIPEHIEGIADLILRMRSDDEFSDIINKINELSPEQLKAISTILSSMN